MEKVIIHLCQVLFLIGLLFGIIRYWRWKLGKGYAIPLNNKSYGLFLAMQLLTVFIMIFMSSDTQNELYLESLNPFGKDAIDFWEYIAIQLFGVVFLMMIANVVGHLMYQITLKKEMSLYEEIMQDHITPSLIVSLTIFIIGLFLSTQLLKPYLFDLISETPSILPMN